MQCQHGTRDSGEDLPKSHQDRRKDQLFWHCLVSLLTNSQHLSGPGGGHNQSVLLVDSMKLCYKEGDFLSSNVPQYLLA